MPGLKPRYSKDEFTRRGKEIYAQIQSRVDLDNHGRIFAVDIETGEYEIDDDPSVATDRLFARLPDPQIYCLRIGGGGVHRFGSISLKRTS